MPKLGKISRLANSTGKAKNQTKLDKDNVPLSGSHREKKLKQWSNDSMTKVMDAVKKGQVGANPAAAQLPKTSLKDRMSGKVEHGSKLLEITLLTLSSFLACHNSFTIWMRWACLSMLSNLNDCAQGNEKVY